MTQRQSNPAVLALLLWLLCALGRAQQPPPPLNASVSDYGTSFIFSPPTICPGCFEAEFGYLHLKGGDTVPAVLTLALPRGHTDMNVLVNLLDSEASGQSRAIHFGNRFDFLVRQQVFSRGGFELTLAPRGTVFIRGGDSGRAGLSVAPQYGWGKNLGILNFNWTAAIGVAPANPRSDYQTSFDYFRAVGSRGFSLFTGCQQELSGGTDTASIEQGVVIPFRNGQVELATEQFNLNTGAEVQVQARVIVNWGRVLRRR